MSRQFLVGPLSRDYGIYNPSIDQQCSFGALQPNFTNTSGYNVNYPALAQQITKIAKCNTTKINYTIIGHFCLETLNYFLCCRCLFHDAIPLQFGRHIFLLQGNGISPQEMDPINIVANLGSSNVHVINFTNPLDMSMHFSISVKGEDSEHFCLLMRHVRSILLHPGVSLDIPIMFAPEVMRGHKANILIISDDEHSKHCWSYPVFGQPELKARSNLLNITCRAKERLEQKFQVSLMSTLEKCDTTNIKSITSETGLYTFAPLSY